MPKNSKDNSYERYSLVKNLAKTYSLRMKYSNYFENFSTKKEKKTAKEINRIKKALNTLCDPYKTIMGNTFFNCKDEYWWIDYYSKSTYYRLRSKAIYSFLLAYKLQ